MNHDYLTEEEIQEGIDSGKWHWTGRVGGCGNQYLVDGRDPGPYMFIGFIVIALILMAAIVFGQTITNADLNKPFTWKAPPASTAVLESLARHQFVPPIDDYPFQQFYYTRQPENMSGPWDWPVPVPLRRLDGTLLFDPPTVYGLPSYGYHARSISSHHRRR